ncbi:MAG: hypothetical protein ABL899_03115, partial [Nitrospira sp.]
EERRKIMTSQIMDSIIQFGQSMTGTEKMLMFVVLVFSILLIFARKPEMTDRQKNDELLEDLGAVRR